MAVSPALVLSQEDILSINTSSVVLNYCIAINPPGHSLGGMNAKAAAHEADDTQVDENGGGAAYLLPLGLMATTNHANSSEANVAYRFYDLKVSLSLSLCSSVCSCALLALTSL